LKLVGFTPFFKYKEILLASQNADVALAYLNEPDDARLTKKKVEGEGRQCLLISGDVKVQKFCDSETLR